MAFPEITPRGQTELPARKVIAILQRLGFSFNELISEKPGRIWVDHRLKETEEIDVYYLVLAPVDKQKYCSGFFTINELRMILKGSGPAIKGSPEQLELAQRSY